MNKDDINNKDVSVDPRLEKILNKISKARVDSAASGAALMEKARILAARLDSDDIEDRSRLLESGLSENIDAATADAVESLSVS